VDDLMNDTARGLVDQLVAARNWPEPALLDAILARGEEAIDPLLEVVRRTAEDEDEDEGADAPFIAVNLLGMLGARSAIPTLLELCRRVDSVGLDDVSRTLGLLGGIEVVEPALAIGRDRTLGWYPRAMALEAAQRAARDDPALRMQVAEAHRALLADLVARAQDLESDEVELAASLVTALAEMADPQARDLIDSAFEAEIVERFLIGPEDVEELYRDGGRDIAVPKPWLDIYRSQYKEHQEILARERQRAHVQQLTRDQRPARAATEPEDDAAPASEPIRNTGPKLGRNDPCWCGSGKKYKKCHLPADHGQG
jgi:SEC-C motif